MALTATPAFAVVPHNGVAAVSAANTARDGTGTLPSIFTGVTAGSKINEVVAVATADPADSTVTLFLSDGATIWYFDEIDWGNPAAASTTSAGFRASRRYDNLILPSGWILKAGITVALTAGVANVFAFGADFT